MVASNRATTSRTNGSSRNADFGLRLLLGALAPCLRGKGSLGVGRHFKREPHLGTGGIVERGFQLVGIGLVGQMPLRFGDAEHEVAARASHELGLGSELADDAGELESRHERRPRRGIGRQRHSCRRGTGRRAAAQARAAMPAAAHAQRRQSRRRWKPRTPGHPASPFDPAARSHPAGKNRRRSPSTPCSPPGLKASRRSSVIVKPVASSGASARSARPCTQI